MTRDEAILPIIRQIYDAAGAPEKWVVCVASVHALFDAGVVNILHYDFKHLHGGFSLTTLTETWAISAYNDYCHKLDRRGTELTMRRIATGVVGRGDPLIEHSQLKKTEFYADYDSRASVIRSLFGILELQAQRITRRRHLPRTGKRLSSAGKSNGR